MRFTRQRLTFQLTPLLDLLLIVIFAQYMEMQETTAATRAQLQDQLAMQQMALERRTELSRVEREHAELSIAAMRQTAELAKKQLAVREIELQAAARSAMEQRDRAGEIFAELFNIPRETLDAALPSGAGDAPRTEADVARLKRDLKELAESSGRDVIRHLLTFEEVKKHCDLWQIHLRDDGVVEFSAGENFFVLRATSKDEFVKQSQMFARYQKLPDAKSLVVMLVSWGDAEFGDREPIIEGLPQLATRLQADAGGRTSFEYALLGYQPKFSLGQPK